MNKLIPLESIVFFFDLYKHKERDWFLLGKESIDGVSFEVLFKIELQPRKDLENSFTNYKNLMNVDGVMTREDMRGMKIGRFMYQYLANVLGYSILGDEIQYFKARLLWVRLSKMENCKVDIIDINTSEVLERDVTLFHGEADHEFDEGIWDYDTIKKHIRLVLTEVL